MRLLERGVPCGLVQDLPGALGHAHTRHRGMIYERGKYRGVAAPIKFSRTPAELRQVPPSFAKASRAVLEEAGYSAAEIDNLAARASSPLATPRPAVDCALNHDGKRNYNNGL